MLKYTMAQINIKQSSLLLIKTGLWLVLIVVTLFIGYILGWMLLGEILILGIPAIDALVLLLIFVLIGFVVSFFMIKYFTTKKQVIRAVFIILSVISSIWVVWAFSSPDDAVYLARTMIWSDSDILDYEKFPERQIMNGKTAFRFKENHSDNIFDDMHLPGKTDNDFDKFIETTKTTSFIVIKSDEILYENYFNGYKRDSVVTSFSIAKSVTTALIGIAVEEGYINNINDPIIIYLPELRNKGMDKVTVKDLLLMSNGISYTGGDERNWYESLSEFKNDDSLAYYYPDMRYLALRVKSDGQEAGTAFKYNHYYPLLLGMILERTTHKPVSMYLQDRIWIPLGMEYPASWSLDSEKSGFEKMESGLNGRAIDFAKFGRLYLNKGTWNGEQIISQSWVHESTAPNPNDNRIWLSDQYWKENNGYYGYMWWGKTKPDGSYIYYAMGHLGQIIAIYPEKEIIIVRFGDGREKDQWDSIIESIIEQIN